VSSAGDVRPSVSGAFRALADYVFT